MAKRQDDHDAVPPTEGTEDGDTLTEEDEAALDKAVAQISDKQLQASVRWVHTWAEEDKKADDH